MSTKIRGKIANKLIAESALDSQKTSFELANFYPPLFTKCDM